MLGLVKKTVSNRFLKGTDYPKAVPNGPVLDEKLNLHSSKMNQPIQDKHTRIKNMPYNEIEFISDEELPPEDQHEDGELSEIRLVRNKEKGA